MSKVIKRVVTETLTELHNDARHDWQRISANATGSFSGQMTPANFEAAYLPISKGQGQHLRQMVIENDLKQVVEFGTSFGISTIYLADAVRQIGGKVVSTELLKSKAIKAQENIAAAGLSDHVELRVGDAMETLKGYSETINLLFLDGWKDLYLPLFKMLEPNFRTGTIIYADNTDMSETAKFTDHVTNQDKLYDTKYVEQGKALLVTKL